MLSFGFLPLNGLLKMIDAAKSEHGEWARHTTYTFNPLL
jgi:hypothetical protein